MEFSLYKRASVGYNKKKWPCVMSWLEPRLYIQSHWMGQKHQPFVCKVGLQWNIPNKHSQYSCKRISRYIFWRYNLHSDECLHRLFNMCACVCKRVEEGKMHSMRKSASSERSFETPCDGAPFPFTFPPLTSTHTYK